MKSEIEKAVEILNLAGSNFEIRYLKTKKEDSLVKTIELQIWVNSFMLCKTEAIGVVKDSVLKDICKSKIVAVMLMQLRDNDYPDIV